ncbi:MAG TPA: VWA domain-containing protein [Bryobacteraceae bacterium]|nr:VWA domain-containing protein [Bryobacteraceae bacterium]
MRRPEVPFLVAIPVAALLVTAQQQTPPAGPAPNPPALPTAAPEEASRDRSAAAESGKKTPPPEGILLGPAPRDLRLPPPPPGPNDYVVSSDVDVVLLDVSVKDSRGGFASGLQKETFKVLEDGKEQQLSIFAAQDTPVTVGLVIDHSGSVRTKRPEVITAALTFAGKSNPQDEVFLVNFNDRAWLGLPENVKFTDNINLLRSSMIQAPMQGRTAIYDALKKALEHVQMGRRDKKTLVVISDGGDNASETTEDEIVRMAEESLVTIYTVGIFGPHEKESNRGFLKKLASITGGEWFMPDEISELVGVCEKIAQDIRNRYTIGYVPTNRTFDGKVRRLKVLASAPDRGKLSVRTRTHYIAALSGNELPHRHKHHR